MSLRRRIVQAGLALAVLTTGAGGAAALEIEGMVNKGTAEAKLNGVSIEAPPRPVSGEWTEQVRDVHANWVAIIPIAFGRTDPPGVRYAEGGQWWGEHPEGVIAQIRQAQAAGLKVMLKPHVWFRSPAWPGNFDAGSETGWQMFEEDYRNYMERMIEIAVETEVELLCLGTELSVSYMERPEYWRELIATARERFEGELTVAANWDRVREVPFWEKLDYIGIDAYFPLATQPGSGMEELKVAWGPIVKAMEAFSKQHGRPILFTEYGYRSVVGAPVAPYDHSRRGEHEVSMEVQEQAYRALFESLWGERWFAGGFLWKWHVSSRRGRTIGGYQNGDYTPQGKPALSVIRTVYRRHGPEME